MPAALYRRLQQHLDRMPVGFPATESGVEIRILKHLFTPEEAGIVLELSGIPEPVEVIHKRLRSRLTLPALEQALESMRTKGIILRLRGKGGPRYGKLIYAVGFYERQLKRLTPGFARDSEQYLEEAFGKAFHRRGTTQMRTVPVNQAIPIERNVASYENIRTYVEASPGPFAAMDCICRTGKELLGEKCKQTSVRENCLTLGMAAREMVNIGAARHITREEMLALLEAADREGLVLQPENTRNPLFVCCCCGCCCAVLTSAKRLPEPASYFSANYYAEIDEGACEQCGLCETRCQMDAIHNGDAKLHVERSHCIGCGLCVSTCPSGAMRMVEKEPGSQKEPPGDTRALYLKLLQERYGKWGMAKLAGRKLLGMKI